MGVVMVHLTLEKDPDLGFGWVETQTQVCSVRGGIALYPQ